MAEPRKRTNAEIDVLNQFVQEGEQPLPYELDADNNPIVQLTEEEKLAAQKVEDERILAEQTIKDQEAAEAKKILDDAAEAEKQRIIAEDKLKNPAPTKIETAPAPTFELDDEKVLAYLKEKKGKDVTSLDDFLNPPKVLTEDEKKAVAEQRDANKIAYGLNKGLFSKKQLEEFITDTTNPQTLVYNLYVQEQKAKDPELSDADIKAEFEEKFGVNEDVESRQYKVGQNLLNNLADNVIRKKHSVILNLDNEFTSYETTQLKQKESEAKILSQAPLYKKDVEETRNEIAKVSIAIDENNNFEVPIDNEIVEEVISGMLDNKYSQSQIESGWDKAKIKEVARATVILKSLPKIMAAYADAQILAKQAGVRGIPPSGKQPIREGDKPELTDRQKIMQQHYFPEGTTIAN